MRRAHATAIPGPRHAPGGRFLLLAAIGMAVSLAALIALVAGTEQLGRRPLAHQAMIDRQLATIEAGLPRAIMVGDSTLDYTIDLATWRALGGPPAASLALTGNFGYEGSYRMIERALAKGPLDTVVIMQTADMMTREDAAPVAAALREPGSPLATLARWWQQRMNARVISRSAKFALARIDEWTGRTAPGGVEDDGDGEAEGETPYVIPPDTPGISAARINRDKLDYLQAIADLCAREGLRCVYAHGPLGSPLCERSAAYLARANTLIRSTGLSLAQPSPVCIPPSQMGDAPDHIDRAFAPAYTRRYLEILAPYLSADPMA